MLSKEIIQWIQGCFEENNRKTAVIGISGGKDSAVVAALCKEALGEQNVYGIMMPNGDQKDISDSKQVIAELGINSGCANIKPVYDAVLQCVEEAIGMPASEGAKINIAPRLRMALLYTIAQTLSEMNKAKACVAGTGNRGEAEVGYTTKWGDSASDINPIRNLWVDEVLQVGDELGYFPDIIQKVPSSSLRRPLRKIG
ncbi:MAG: NAD(+) synthase [Oscillospiraceae bacterium]|nr:NAD(+) synthase [Oscillospiraceae bacterium]